MGNENIKETKPKAAPKPEPVYLAIQGINYGATEENPAGVRVEAGEVVPAEVVKQSPWLLEMGHVRPRKGVADV